MTAPLDPSLHECELCSAKPGTPTLCATCLENRRAAGARWLEERRAARAEVERLKNGCAVHDGPTSIVHRHFHDAVVETLTKERDTAIAERDAALALIAGAGLRVGSALSGEAALWCVECQRSDAFHWSGCSKVKPWTERIAELVAERKTAQAECEKLRARVAELEARRDSGDVSLPELDRPWWRLVIRDCCVADCKNPATVYAELGRRNGYCAGCFAESSISKGGTDAQKVD